MKIWKKCLNLALTIIFEIQFVYLPSNIPIRIEMLFSQQQYPFPHGVIVAPLVLGSVFFLCTHASTHACRVGWHPIPILNYYLCFSFTYVKTVTGRRLDCNLINKTDVEYIQNLIPPCLILPTFHWLSPPLSTAISQALFQYCDIIALNLLL